MSEFIEVRALAGMNYVRARDVIAVQYLDPLKCSLMLAGGLSIPCSEPAKQVVSRLDAAMRPTSEIPDGNASE